MAGAPAQYAIRGSALPPATGAIYSRMAAVQERNVPPAGICRISGLLRAGQRANKCGTGCAGFAPPGDGAVANAYGPASFSGSCRPTANLLAHRAMGRAIPPAGFRTFAIERFGHRDVSKVPAEIPVQQRLGHTERPERGNYFRQRDAHDDPPVYRRVAQGPAAQLRGSGDDLAARVDLGRLRG